MVGEVAGTNQARPDWYPDPTGRHQYRYWDGSRWTGHVADQGITSSDPLDVAPGVASAKVSQPKTRAEEIKSRLAEIDQQLDSLRERIRKDVEARSDTPGGNILIASVLERLGESPPQDLAGTPTLGQLDALEKEKGALQAELAQLERPADGNADRPSSE